MVGDAAYDSTDLRKELDEHGTKPVIPNRCNRKQPFTFNKRLYKLRWRIAKFPCLCLPRRGSCMVDLMSPDPSLVGR